MSKRIECPSLDQLKSFMQGKVNEAEVSDIAQHLDRCTPCEGKAQTLCPDDTFLQDAQGDFAQTDRLAAEIPPLLVEKLKTLPRQASQEANATVEVSQMSIATDEPAEASFLAPPQQPDEIGRMGTYRILDVLGKGGMGIVFLAHDPHLDRRIALKVMLPKIAANAAAKHRFLREARIAAKVKSDHIVHIYQVAEERGVPFLAMELLEGAPLDQLLQEGRPLTVPQILRIGREIAHGLSSAHAMGLIHRDIKPGNLWLDKTHAGRIKILDFGLARSEKDDIHLTKSGAILGTPAYMAPEQARGDKDVDARADLFSLGCVLYRLCAGDIPFKGETTMGVLLAIAMDEPTAPAKINAQIPRALSDLILQLLDKNPVKRPSTALEVIDRLTGIEKSLGGVNGDIVEWSLPSERRELPSQTTRHAFRERANGEAKATPLPRLLSGKRRPVALALVACLLIGLIALAGTVFFWQTPDGQVVRIECDDPAIQIAFNDGDLKITGAYQDALTLKPGKNGLKIKKGDTFEFETDKLIVNKGDKIVLKIEFAQGKVQIVQAGKGVLDAKDLPAPIVQEKKPTQMELEFDSRITQLPMELQLDPKGSFTLEAWVNPDKDDFGNVANILNFPWQATLRTSITGREWNFEIHQEISKNHHVRGLTLEKGRFVHLAGVRHPTEMALYIDGKLAIQIPIRNEPLGQPKLNPAISGGRFAGRIREIRISQVARYSEDFTPQQRFEPDRDTLALYHMDEGQGDVLTDSSGRGHHAKIRGAKWVQPVVVQDTYPPLDRAWVQQVAALPAEKQVDVVVAKLKERNAGFDDKSVTHQIEGGMVTSLEVKSENLVDVTPLRALVGLRTLTVTSGELVDLAPLRALTQLRTLICRNNLGYYSTAESDATVLRSMKTLETINGKPVAQFWKEVEADKAAFKEWLQVTSSLPATEQLKEVSAKLRERNPGFDDRSVVHKIEGGVVTELGFVPIQIKDLSPVRALTGLQVLTCSDISRGMNPLSDLSPLKEMKLTKLRCQGTKVADLSPLKDLKLTELILSFTKVADLSPLKGMPLSTLNLDNTRVSDLSPLKGMPLTVLSLYNLPKVTDLSPLKGMPLTYLHCHGTEVSDLSPLKGMELTLLACGKRVTDLSPLKGMPLVRLQCWHCRDLSDLSPLQGMKLTHLSIVNTKVTDLSPLKGMPLKEIIYDFRMERDAEILRSFKTTLESINQMPAADFWKKARVEQTP